jgi:hypothetical protein
MLVIELEGDFGIRPVTALCTMRDIGIEFVISPLL